MKKWKMGWILICGLVLLSACTTEDSDTDDIGASLEDRLSSALEFEGGEVVNGELPATEADPEKAPQMIDLDAPVDLVGGQTFTVVATHETGSGPNAETPFTHTLVKVEGATGYIKVPSLPQVGDFGMEAILFGRLKDIADLRGKNFVIHVMLMDGSGNVGTFIVWNLTILNRDPVTPEEIADKVGGEGWSLTMGDAPPGSGDAGAPQITHIESPTHLTPGVTFEIDLYTDYANKDNLESAIISLPIADGYFVVEGPVTSTEKGLVMTVPGSVSKDLEVIDWSLTFMLALKSKDGSVGQYREWTVLIVRDPGRVPDPECDDEDPCTDDLVENFRCVYVPKDCSDGLDCTVDSCNPETGACVNAVSEGYCRIDGACVADGTSNTENVCLACDADADAEGWSYDNTASCDDENLCTQTDVCQNGECRGSNPVTCTAPDQCHDAGTCNPQSGDCENASAKEDGFACDLDQSACTADTCQSGVCTAGTAVVCVAPDQCHDAGTCNPQNGQCENVQALADETACDLDTDLCTQDYCLTGVCTAGDSVVCEAMDQCHDVGVCDPATGICSDPALADETACDLDTDLCTQDYCMTGVCTAGDAVVCEAMDQCHDVGTCDPTTGICSDPELADETACDLDESLCTPDYCMTGVCTAGDAVVCEALDQCHDVGVCDPATGICSDPIMPEDYECNDENPYTYNDRCQDGVCIPDICGNGENEESEQCDDGEGGNTDTPCDPSGVEFCTYCDTSCMEHTVYSGVLEGVVTNATQFDIAPVAGATVEIVDGPSAVTDADGRFSINGLLTQQGVVVNIRGPVNEALNLTYTSNQIVTSVTLGETTTIYPRLLVACRTDAYTDDMSNEINTFQNETAETCGWLDHLSSLYMESGDSPTIFSGVNYSESYRVNISGLNLDDKLQVKALPEGRGRIPLPMRSNDNFVALTAAYVEVEDALDPTVELTPYPDSYVDFLFPLSTYLEGEMQWYWYDENNSMWVQRDISYHSGGGQARGERSSYALDEVYAEIDAFGWWVGGYEAYEDTCFSGRVLLDGQPVEGAEVIFFGDYTYWKHSATTGADGTFCLDGFAEGYSSRLQVVYWAAPGERYASEIWAPSTGTDGLCGDEEGIYCNTLGDINLQPANPQCKTIRVTRQDDSQSPVEPFIYPMSVYEQYEGPGPFRGRFMPENTGNSGDFCFLAPKEYAYYIVKLWQDGYYTPYYGICEYRDEDSFSVEDDDTDDYEACGDAGCSTSDIDFFCGYPY